VIAEGDKWARSEGWAHSYAFNKSPSDAVEACMVPRRATLPPPRP
jgi:hypothetical protein